MQKIEYFRFKWSFWRTFSRPLHFIARGGRTDRYHQLRHLCCVWWFSSWMPARGGM